MKKYISILITTIALLCGMCCSCDKINTETVPFPSSITLQGINISGAEGLAIMNIPKESAQTKASTKADDEPLTRLVIVSKDGTKIAEFYMKIEGATNNPLWQKIYPTLTYVPEHIIDFSTNFILLANVHADYDYDLSTSEGFQTKQSLDKAINTATGNYLLRKGDGVLFSSPFNIDACYYPMNFDVNETSDHETLICGGAEPELVLIKDTGSKLESISTNGQIFSSRDYLFSYLPDNKHCVVFLNNSNNGAWSFDMNLLPTYMDFGDNLKYFFNQKDPVASFFVSNGNSPYFFGHNENHICVISKIVVEGGKVECVSLSEVMDKLYPNYTTAIDETYLSLFFEGRIVKINTHTDNVTVLEYPDGFPKYNQCYSDGVYQELSSDFKTITRYDLNTMQKKTVNVNWAGYDELVSGTNYGGVGFFTVTGLSRTAATLSYLINQDTGEVTLLESQTYTAPAVTSYLPLN